MDLQLTTHFYLSEFTRSTTAQSKGIDNTPSLEVVKPLPASARTLADLDR